MAAKRRVWVTRAAPAAEQTAERLRALGVEPIVAPLLEIRPLAGPEIDLTGVGAIAFTSANAVRSFAECSTERGLTVFAVGAATAAAAKAARFRSVLSTDGDVASLAAGIASRKREIVGEVLHPSAAEPAGDLKGALTRRGIPTRGLALYESVPVRPPEAFLAQIPNLFGVVLHSPKAARGLAAILEAAPAPRLRAWCLSRAVARPLAATPLAELTAASSPSEDALLKLIAR
jgi:uroporphyrinogen-III synthase